MAIITDIPIYHITHIRNLESIIAKGGLLCDSEMTCQGIKAKEIAYPNLKERRAKTFVPVAAKGTLADYVPFYFTNRSPMLGAIHSGKVIGYQSGQRQVLHLVSSVQRIIRGKMQLCFTDGHAVEAPTHFFDNIEDINQIDMYLIGRWEWGNTLDDPDRKRRKQAEFLVYKFLPWQMVEAIGVHDQEIAGKVQKIICKSTYQPLIKVEQKWYYQTKVRA